jgi:hypothetical protein
MDPEDMNLTHVRQAMRAKPQRTRLASIAQPTGRLSELRWGAGRRKRVVRLRDPWLMTGLYIALRGGA